MTNSNYEETIQWYENNAEEYAIRTKEYEAVVDRKQLDEFASLIPVGGKVLDAGCGAGRDTNIFKRKGYNAVGADIAENLVSEAKKSYPDCNFITGDILNLPFEDNLFDGVWAHASIVHFDNNDRVQKALEEFARVLKTDGLLHVLVGAQGREGNDYKGLYYRNYTIAELNKLLNEAGFEVPVMKQYGETRVRPDRQLGKGIEWIVALARKA